MIGRTNISGGIFNFSSAIIHAVAPTGSTLYFLANGIIRKTISPQDSILNSSDNNFSDYFYKVNPKDYGEWTITSSPTFDSRSVTVAAIDMYHVFIANEVYLYKTGTYTPFYNKNTFKPTATITDNAASISIKTNGSSVQNGYVYWNNVDLTWFNTITLGRYTSDTINRYIGIFITQDLTIESAVNASIRYHENYTGKTSYPIYHTLDISNYSGYWRVGVGCDSNNSSWSNARTENIVSVALS